ncbi:MAG: polyprenyl synthetase family protein, partial [Pseudomonadota bacterium]
ILAEEAAEKAAERGAEEAAERGAKKAAERGAPPPEPADALARIERLQSLKTGALIRAAAALGAALGGADPEGRAALDDYAAALGLAFQIADDLLDVGGDENAAGKRLRKDADAGKATFVDLLGVERARDRAEALAAEAAGRLRPFGDGATLLRQAADFAVRRTR